MRRTWLLVAALGATVSPSACGGDGGQAVPTEQQARAALDTKFEQAKSGDPEAFCGDTHIPDMCRSQWERLGGTGGVPKDRPRVVSAREQDGYRVLRVCGTDGRGQQFRTDFVVGMDDDKIVYALPVFWNGATFSGVHGDDTGRVDEARPTSSAGDCS